MLRLFFLVAFYCATLCSFAQDVFMRAKQQYDRNNGTAAIPLLKQAVNEGFADAAYLLGTIYYSDNIQNNVNRFGVSRNYVLARQNFEKGIQLGCENGDTELGYIYYFAWGVDKNITKAVEHLAKGVDKDNEDAKFLLGQLYFLGNEVEQNFKLAFDMLKSTVNEKYLYSYDRMNATSARILGICYENGLGCKRNVAKALLYYRKSNGEAFFRGGLLMDRLKMASTSDCSESEGEYGSVSYYLQSAIKAGVNIPLALYLHAINMANEIPVEDRKNPGRDNIARAMMKAANAGHAAAQKTLGDWYANGWFVSKNLVKAKELYAKCKYNPADAERIEKDRLYRNSKGIYRIGDVFKVAFNSSIFADSLSSYIVVNIDSMGTPTRLMSTKEYRISSGSQYQALINEHKTTPWQIPLKHEVEVLYKHADSLNAWLKNETFEISAANKYAYKSNRYFNSSINETFCYLDMKTGEVKSRGAFNCTGFRFRPVVDYYGDNDVPQWPEYLVNYEGYVNNPERKKLDEDVTYRNSKGCYFPGDLYFYEPEQKYYIVAGTDLMNKPVRLMTIEAEKVDTYYKYNNLSNVPSKADVTMVYQTRDRVNKNLQQINLPSLPVNAKLAFKEKGQNALNYIDFSGGSFRYSILGNSSSVQGYNIHRAYDLKNGTLVK